MKEILKENSNITRKGITKFDPDTAKTLPISTGRKRKKGFFVERTYNGLTIKIEAIESLNAYDLITLFQMLDDYQKEKEEWEEIGYAKTGDYKRKLVKRRFDLKKLCKERGVLTKKINRKTIAKSVERWYKAEITYLYPETTIQTRYIFEYVVDENFEYVGIVANANFLDFCIENGTAMNWGRLAKYGKNAYAVQLDIYLQFRAIQIGKKKKRYRYPRVLREERLFHHIGIEGEIQLEREKRKKLREAFRRFEEVTGQKYIEKTVEGERKWIHAPYLQYLQKKDYGA